MAYAFSFFSSGQIRIFYLLSCVISWLYRDESIVRGE
jgi:hypothetical protein